MTTPAPVRVLLLAAPIGNYPDDMSPAAREGLASVDHVFVEELDARLLDTLRASGELTDAHALYEMGPGAPDVASDLVRTGQDFALLANAGLPGFVDPGHAIIRRMLFRHLDAVTISPLGMSSALDAALCMAGLDLHRFAFLGHHPAAASFEPQHVGQKIPMVWYVAGRSVTGFLRTALAKVPDIASVMIFRNVRSRSTQRIWVLKSPRLHVPDDMVDDEHDRYVVVVEPGKARRFDTD